MTPEQQRVISLELTASGARWLLELLGQQTIQEQHYAEIYAVLKTALNKKAA